MSRQEVQYADSQAVGIIDGEQIVDNEIIQEMHGLIDAHRGYDNADYLHDDEIKALEDKIKELKTQRDEMVNGKDQARSQQAGLRHRHADRIVHMLADPHNPVDPVYRAALLAPRMNQGSLWYPNTLRIAEQFGRRLVEFSSTLKEAETSQPALGVVSYTDLSGFNLSYGMTKPRSGLEPRSGHERVGTCGCGTSHYETTPYLGVPIIESTKAAVQPDYWHPYYDRSDGRRTTLNNGVEKVEVVEHKAVEPEPIELQLATGNFYDDDHTLGYYDKNGKALELQGPQSRFSEKPIRFIAIGEQAVKKALTELNRNISSESRHPEMFTHMFELVALALGVAVKLKSKTKTA